MTCRLCGGVHTAQKYVIPSPSGSFPVYECMDCGFQFRDLARPDAYAFYDEGYYTGGAAFSYQDERRNEKASRIVWRARARKLKKWDRSAVPAGARKKYLDVGCSFGGLMGVFGEEGYQPYGAEVSAYSAGYAAQRFGKDRVFTGSIEDIGLGRGVFSVITMVEVIEHLFDPRRALANCREAMLTGGVLLVQTADMDGLQARLAKERYHYYLPGHLSCFNRFNLRKTLFDCGFSRVKVIGGVEFGLLPKLLKSRLDFKKGRDYLKWARIALYHLASKVCAGPLHLTSSMTVVAWK